MLHRKYVSKSHIKKQQARLNLQTKNKICLQCKYRCFYKLLQKKDKMLNYVIFELTIIFLDKYYIFFILFLTSHLFHILFQISRILFQTYLALSTFSIYTNDALNLMI